MTFDENSFEMKAGLTRRAAIGTLAAAIAVPAMQEAADAQRAIQPPPGKGLPITRDLLSLTLATPRTAHTATMLYNGLLLVAGGMQFTIAPLSGVQLFNPVLGEWRNAASLQTSRFDHAAALLPDGRVLVCGGVHSGGRAMAGCEIYDPRTDAWSEAAPLNVARSGHAAMPFVNGTVLAMGGYGSKPIAGCEIYDPVRDVWEVLDSALRSGGELG